MTEYDAMETVLAPLWRIPASQSRSLYQHEAFKLLERDCEATYANFGRGFSRSFALIDGLRAVGLPCEQQPGLPAVDVATAARRFVDAMKAPMITRRFLAPLHLADDLPALSFGASRMLKSRRAYDVQGRCQTGLIKSRTMSHYWVECGCELFRAAGTSGCGSKPDFAGTLNI